MAEFDVKNNYTLPTGDHAFEFGNILHAEDVKKLAEVVRDSANAEEVAKELTNLDNKLGTVPDGTNVMGEINKKADQSTTYTKTEVDTALSGKATSNQGIDNKGKFWKVGEDGGLTFEAGVPVDTTLTKAGEAADAEAVGKALNKKGDSIEIQG